MLCRLPIRWRRSALMAVVSLSRAWLLVKHATCKGTGSGNWHEEIPWYGWPLTPFRGQKVKSRRSKSRSPGRLTPWSKIRTGTPTNFKLGIRTRITDMRSELQSDSSGWLFKHLQLGGILWRSHYRPQILFTCVLHLCLILQTEIEYQMQQCVTYVCRVFLNTMFIDCCKYTHDLAPIERCDVARLKCIFHVMYSRYVKNINEDDVLTDLYIISSASATVM